MCFVVKIIKKTYDTKLYREYITDTNEINYSVPSKSIYGITTVRLTTQYYQ